MAVKLHDTTGDLSATLSNVFTDLQDLRNECQEQYDGMPESFQSGERGDRLQEVISALDDFVDEEPEVPAVVEELKVTWAENRRKNLTRAARAGNAAAMLSGVYDALGEWLGDDDNSEHADRDDVQALSDAVETAMNAAESLEF